MKLNIHNTLLAASALIIAASTSSCRKDLCYNHFPEAGVTLSYENEWERDYGMGWLSGWDADLYGSTYDNLRPGNPEGVTMVAYHPDGITEFYMSTAGGNVSFGASVHSLLFYNNDTQYIILNDMASLPSHAPHRHRVHAPLSANFMPVSAPSIRPMCSMPPIRPKCPS